MHIPESVKIGGFVFKIVQNGEINHEEAGCIDFEKMEIRLNNNITGQFREIVLLHEIVHGIFDHCNIKCRDLEDSVERISKALYQVIKDNEDIFI